MAGFSGGSDCFLYWLTQLFPEAVPVGHSGQRVARRRQLGQVSSYPLTGIFSVARAFIQSSPKVIHCVDESTQSVHHKSIAVSIDRKQYLRDDQLMTHQIEASNNAPGIDSGATT